MEELQKVKWSLIIDGVFVSDELFLLNMYKGEDKAAWVSIKTKGPTPGQRYGHSISFSKPYIVVFGGSSSSGVLNDLWFLSVPNMPFL